VAVRLGLGVPCNLVEPIQRSVTRSIRMVAYWVSVQEMIGAGFCRRYVIVPVPD
jgi:hypothetical protein